MQKLDQFSGKNTMITGLGTCIRLGLIRLITTDEPINFQRYMWVFRLESLARHSDCTLVNGSSAPPSTSKTDGYRNGAVSVGYGRIRLRDAHCVLIVWLGIFESFSEPGKAEKNRTEY